MNIYDFVVKGTDGSDVSLKNYEGKVLLVVNTATACGLTPQYEAMQKLHDKYAGRGLMVLDFPCNQFLNQTPGSDAEIESFCTTNYGTTFTRFAKIDVNGANADALYVWLKKQAGADKHHEAAAEFEGKVKQFTEGSTETDIKWNFGKFLIDKSGNVVARYSPICPPESLEGDIEGLLG